MTRILPSEIRRRAGIRLRKKTFPDAFPLIYSPAGIKIYFVMAVIAILSFCHIDLMLVDIRFNFT